MSTDNATSRGVSNDQTVSNLVVNQALVAKNGMTGAVVHSARNCGAATGDFGLSVSDIKNGAVLFSSGAALNVILPAASNLVNGFPPSTNLIHFYIYKGNNAGTVAAGSGGTLVTANAVSANNIRALVILITNRTAGAEAYSILGYA